MQGPIEVLVPNEVGKWLFWSAFKGITEGFFTRGCLKHEILSSRVLLSY